MHNLLRGSIYYLLHDALELVSHFGLVNHFHSEIHLFRLIETELHDAEVTRA